ncbi:MAG: VTT domain-containing protein [Pseudomonadota bacterium]
MEWIEQLQSLAQQQPLLAALAYISLYAGVMLAGLPGGLAMLLLGGFLFGNLPAAGLALVGAGLAAALVYPMARGPLGRFVTRRAGSARMGEMSLFVHRQGVLGLLLVRMIPLFPFALLNVGLAVAGVPWARYLITTVVGTVPIALLVTRVGSQMSSLLDLEEASGFGLLLDPQVLAPLLALIGLVVMGLIWRRRTNAST